MWSSQRWKIKKKEKKIINSILNNENKLNKVTKFEIEKVDKVCSKTIDKKELESIKNEIFKLLESNPLIKNLFSINYFL